MLAPQCFNLGNKKGCGLRVPLLQNDLLCFRLIYTTQALKRHIFHSSIQVFEMLTEQERKVGLIYLTSGRLFHYFLFFMLFSHQHAKQAPRFASSAALSSTWSPVHCTWNEKHHVVIIDGRFKEILTWRKLEYVLNVLFYSHFVTPVTRHI